MVTNQAEARAHRASRLPATAGTVLLVLVGCAAIGSGWAADGSAIASWHQGAVACQDLVANPAGGGGHLDAGAVTAALRRSVSSRLAAAEARRSGMAGDPEVALRLERARQRLLTMAMEATFTPAEAGEAELEKEFEEHREELARPQRIVTRWIFWKLAADASDEERHLKVESLRAIRERVLAGESFAALARQLSEAENASRGGAVAPSARGTLLAEYEEAAWALAPGELSDVVRLPEGLALILLERVDPARAPTFDEAVDQVRRHYRARREKQAREAALARARQRWPYSVEGERLGALELDPDTPVVRWGGSSLSFRDLGLEVRPPRPAEVITRRMEERLLARLAERELLPADAALAGELQAAETAVLAQAAIDRRLETALAELLPDPSQAYRRHPRVAHPEARRSFRALIVPGEEGALRVARQAAEEARSAWATGGRPPAGSTVELWGPMTRRQLATWTSPRFAAAAFAAETDSLSAPLRLETYVAATARFVAQGYAVLEVAASDAPVPSLGELASTLRRQTLGREIVEARARQVRDDLLERAGWRLDQAALVRCLAERSAP